MARQVSLPPVEPVSLNPFARSIRDGICSTHPCLHSQPQASHDGVTGHVLQDTGEGLPVLHLFQGGWSNRTANFRGKDRYTVEEINTGMDGRAFLLHREPEAIAKSADKCDRYGVLIARNGQDDVCECRGFESHGRCKHVTALRGLIEAGHIDLTTATATPRAVTFPTPEQVAHDAKRPDSLLVDPFGMCISEADADLHVGASYKPGHSSDIAF